MSVSWKFKIRAVMIPALLIMLALMGCKSTEEAKEIALDEEGAKIFKAMPDQPSVEPGSERKILVFSLCKGYAHDVIPVAKEAIRIMGEKTGAFEAHFSDRMSAFEAENLSKFDAVLFNNTTQLDFENPAHRKALLEFVESGKGVVGIHAATDSFYEWPEGAKMMGGLFDGHPWGAGGTWALKIDEPDHPLNRAFGGEAFLIRDEIYQIKGPYSRDTHRVLLSLDMSSYRNTRVEGMKRDDMDFAVSWIRTQGRGRIFYCSLGHNPDVFRNTAVLRHYLDGIQFALGDLKADAAPSARLDPRPKPALTTDPGGLDDPFTKIPRHEFGQSRVVLSGLEAEIRTAPAQRLQEIESKLIEILESPKATYAGKLFVCRMLRRVGSKKAVLPLSRLLNDEKLSDPARFALQGLPYPEADDVLLNSLDTLKGDLRIGVIGSIAQRKDRRAVPKIAPWTRSDDLELAGACISALGRIGGIDGARVLGHLEAPEALRGVRDDALLMCADQLLGENEPAAQAIYRDLAEKENPAMTRIAAYRGLLKTAGEEALPLLLAMLNDEDPKVRRTAGRFINEAPGIDVATGLAEQLPALPEDARVLVLEAFAVRGDRATLPAAAAAVNSEIVAVRVAAVNAVGALGGAEHVELLAHTAVYEGEDGNAALGSLCRLTGEGVDEAILDSLEANTGEVRAVLITAVKERRCPGAVETFLEFAEDPDPEVRRASIEGLEALASEWHIYSLLDLLKNTKDEDDREGIENAVLSTLNRFEDQEKRAKYLLAYLEEAPDLAMPARTSLIVMLGRLPCEQSLQVLYDAAQRDEAEVRDAAVRALAEWPDAAPMAFLFEVARTTVDESLHAHLFDGYLRMANLVKDRDPDERRKIYENALVLARTQEEKARTLEASAKAADFWVLGFLKSFRKDPSLREDAEAALMKVQAALARTVSHDAQGCPVRLVDPYKDKYSGGGKDALTDGNWGSRNFGDGRWQGFEGKDLDAIIDLGREIRVKSVRVGFLEDMNSWIFFPTSVEISLSLDGKDFQNAAAFSREIPSGMTSPSLEDFSTDLEELPARYVRVRAKNVGVCPPWHPGNGGSAWLFADEIQVNPHFDVEL